MRIILSISCFFFFFLSYTQSYNGIVSSGSYLIDSNSKLSRTDLHLEKFLPLNYAENINIGYNENAAIWCSIRILNKLPKQQVIWLCFDNYHLDSLQLYDGNSMFLLGDRTKNKSSFLTAHSFKIHLKPKQEKHFIVRLKKGISFMDFSYRLRTENELKKSTQKTMFLVSFLLGIIFLLIIFNSILYIVNKKKIYVLYILNSIITASYIMIATGTAKFFVFPNFLFFSEARIYTASLWFINLTIFISYFLELNKTQKTKFKIILILNTFNLLLILVTISMVIFKKTYFLDIFSVLGYLNFIGILFFTLWATFRNMKIDRNNSIYVFMAFLPNSIWALSIILKALKIIPKEIHSEWLVLISIYEVLLFGYILTRNYFETFQKNNVLNQVVIQQKENAITAVLSAQINERSQISNILHDQYGSKLSHILLLFKLKKHDLAFQNVQEITKELRDLSHQIMPKSLEEGALISGLQTYINTLNSENGECIIELYTFDFPEHLNKELSFNMYLIALELISNALKHAKPSEIILEFYKYNESYIFQFTDNGKGFDIQTTPKGFGLKTIESRIAGIAGIFEINSNKAKGTVIQITVSI